MKILIITLCILSTGFAFGQVTPQNLQQYDNRIYVDIMIDKVLKGFKPQSQYIGASITNKTNDELYIEVEYWAALTCEPSRTSGFVKVTLKPGEVSKADFWATVNSFDVVDRLTSFCKTEQLGLRRKIAEEQYSWIYSTGYQILKIENLTEKKRKEQLEQKQKEISAYISQGDNYLKNKSYDAAIKNYESALSLDNSNATAKQKLQNAKSEKERYLAEEKKKEQQQTQTVSNSSNTGSKTTSSNDSFWDDAPASTTSSTSSNQTAQKSRAQQEQEALDKLNKEQNRFFENMEKQKQVTARNDAFRETSYYLSERRSQAEQGLYGNSSFNRTYDNVEDLNYAFQQQVQQINQSSSELAEVKNQQLNNTINHVFGDSDNATQAVGEVVGLVGNIVNNVQAERDRKYAEEKLEKERQEQIARIRAEEARIEAQRKQRILDLKNEIFKQFPEGGVPLSRHNITLDELYFFTYAYNEDRTYVKVSNVFPYAKYQDGTWAFKDKVTAESEKTTGSKVVLVGYYTTKALAEKERAAFIKLLPQAEVQVSSFEVKGKKQEITTGNSSRDFWGNEIKSENKPTQEKSAESDFWGNPVNKTESPSEKKEPTKTSSFWD